MSLMLKLKGIFGLGGNGSDAPASSGIPCHEALAVVREFLDGELEDVVAAEVEAHFDVCQRCYPHLRLEAAFRDAMRRVTRGETAPSELRAKVKALLVEAEG